MLPALHFCPDTRALRSRVPGSASHSEKGDSFKGDCVQGQNIQELGRNHSGCKELHQNVQESTEILENLVYLIRHETEEARKAHYIVMAERQLLRLRQATHSFRVFIGERGA